MNPKTYKNNFNLSSLISLLFLGNSIFLLDSNAMDLSDEDVHSTNAYLCRTAGNKWQKDKRTVLCEYLSLNGSVKWSDTTHDRIHRVFGPEFDQLNAEIAYQKDTIKGYRCNVLKGNILTIILAATGRSNNDKFKGYYANLRVYFGEKGQPVFKVSCSNKYKVATFCSESFNNFKIDDYKKTYSLNKALKTHEFIHPQCGHSRPKTHLGDCQAKPGHSECRAIREIMALPPNTFSKLLPEKYQGEVVFNEIHFISYWDACSEFLSAEMCGCSVMLSASLGNFKARFGNNLFVFYHSAFNYDEAIYSLHINEELVNDARWKAGNFIVDEEEESDEDQEKQKKNSPSYTIQRKQTLLLNNIPSFYIGI